MSPVFLPLALRSSSQSLPGAADSSRTPPAENQSSPRGSTTPRTLVHRLQAHTRGVPRHYFRGDVFLLFLQLFLITSFGYYIPRKPWQTQRCKGGRDEALIRTILDTLFTEMELQVTCITGMRPKSRGTSPDKLGVSPHTAV